MNAPLPHYPRINRHNCWLISLPSTKFITLIRIASTTMGSYYDVDAILTDAEKVPCTFNLDLPGLGFLDESPNEDVRFPYQILFSIARQICTLFLSKKKIKCFAILSSHLCQFNILPSRSAPTQPTHSRSGSPPYSASSASANLATPSSRSHHPQQSQATVNSTR